MPDSSNPETSSPSANSASPVGHRITLRGPWSVRLLLRGHVSSAAAPLRVTVPGPWTLGDLPVEAAAIYTRWFNAPVRPPVGEQLWLIFPGIGGSGEVWLNGACLGSVVNTTTDHLAANAAFRIDPLLKPRNELEVRLQPTGPLATRGLYGAAVLEFRPEAVSSRE